MARALGTDTPTLYFCTTGVALCFIPRSLDSLLDLLLDLLQVPETATLTETGRQGGGATSHDVFCPVCLLPSCRVRRSALVAGRWSLRAPLPSEL